MTLTHQDRRRVDPNSRPEGWVDDAGPPLDPDSPFTEKTAAERRNVARHGRARGRLRTLASWLTAVAIVVGAVYVGTLLTGYRLSSAKRVSLGSVILTARQIAVPAPVDGQVVSVSVRPSQTVAAGATLAVMRVFDSRGAGTATASNVTITAPVSGVVSSITTPAGSGAQRGGPVVQMYDPSSQTFQASLPTSAVSQLKRGMHVRLTSPAISGWIPAIVDHVVSPLQQNGQTVGGTTTASPTTPGGMTIVLRPRRAGYVSGLAPGLQFDAIVTTGSAPPHAPDIVRVVGS